MFFRSFAEIVHDDLLLSTLQQVKTIDDDNDDIDMVALLLGSMNERIFMEISVALRLYNACGNAIIEPMLNAIRRNVSPVTSPKESEPRQRKVHRRKSDVAPRMNLFSKAHSSPRNLLSFRRDRSATDLPSPPNEKEGRTKVKLTTSLDFNVLQPICSEMKLKSPRLGFRPSKKAKEKMEIFFDHDPATHNCSNY